MTEPLSFDNAPDRELGDRLRSALDGGEPELFLARMRDAVRQAGRETPWDVLTRWAPAGLVAAAAAALFFWLVLGPAAGPDPGMQLMASAPARMEIAPGQAEADVLVSSVLEGR